MIERTAAVAFGEPEKAERAMSVVMPRIDGANTRKALPGLARSAKRLERRGAIVGRRCISGFGGDRCVELRDGFAMPAIRRGDHAEIVDNGRMSRSKPQRVTVGGLGLVEAPGFVMHDRVGDALL